MPNEEGARNVFGGGGLVSGFKPPFRSAYGFHAKTNWAFQACYEVAGMANEFRRHPARRGCFVGRGLLAICINPRWSSRSGERLDFYLQETLPDEERQS